MSIDRVGNKTNPALQDKSDVFANLLGENSFEFNNNANANAASKSGALNKKPRSKKSQRKKIPALPSLPASTKAEDMAKIIPKLIEEMSPSERKLLIKLAYAETLPRDNGLRNKNDVANVLNSIIWRAVYPHNVSDGLFGKTREDGTRSIISVISIRSAYSPLNGFTRSSMPLTVNESNVNAIGNKLMKNFDESDADYQRIEEVLTGISEGEVPDRTNRALHYGNEGASTDKTIYSGKGRNDGKLVYEGGHIYMNNVDGLGAIPKQWVGWQTYRRQEVAKIKNNSEENKANFSIAASGNGQVIPQPVKVAIPAFGERFGTDNSYVRISEEDRSKYRITGSRAFKTGLNKYETVYFALAKEIDPLLKDANSTMLASNSTR